MSDLGYESEEDSGMFTRSAGFLMHARFASLEARRLDRCLGRAKDLTVGVLEAVGAKVLEVCLALPPLVVTMVADLEKGRFNLCFVMVILSELLRAQICLGS